MNNKLFALSICLLILAGPTFAVNFFNLNPTKIIDHHKCAKELQNILYSKWGASRKWQKQLTPSITESAFKSPTDTTGKWVYVRLDENNIRTSLRDNKSTLVVDWSFDCTKSVSRISHKSQKRKLKNSIADSEILKMIKNKKDGIIYIWAPEMPYSVQGIREIKKSAIEMGLDLTILLSPVSNIEFAKKILKEKNLDFKYLKRHNSIELSQRGVDLHYPSLITYKSSKLNRYARLGYEPTQFFSTYLKEEFSK